MAWHGRTRTLWGHGKRACVRLLRHDRCFRSDALGLEHLPALSLRWLLRDRR